MRGTLDDDHNSLRQSGMDKQHVLRHVEHKLSNIQVLVPQKKKPTLHENC